MRVIALEKCPTFFFYLSSYEQDRLSCLFMKSNLGELKTCLSMVGEVAVIKYFNVLNLSVGSNNRGF